MHVARTLLVTGALVASVTPAFQAGRGPEGDAVNGNGFRHSKVRWRQAWTS